MKRRCAGRAGRGEVAAQPWWSLKSFGLPLEGSGRSGRDSKWQSEMVPFNLSGGPLCPRVECGLQSSQPRAGRLLWGSEEKHSGSEGRR